MRQRRLRPNREGLWKFMVRVPTPARPCTYIVHLVKPHIKWSVTRGHVAPSKYAHNAWEPDLASSYSNSIIQEFRSGATRLAMHHAHARHKLVKR